MQSPSPCDFRIRRLNIFWCLYYCCRIVDGVEDDGSPYKRHSFDFPPAARSQVHAAAARHTSLTLTPRQPLVGESRMRNSFTAPQLSHGKLQSSVESQKGVSAVQRCSVENQRGAIADFAVQAYSTNALLALSRRHVVTWLWLLI